MSSYLENLDIINTHIGGKRTVKAKIERQKRQKQKITENARAFERRERGERGENNYESPPPELPSESANNGSNINNGLPRNNPPSPPPPPNDPPPPPPDTGFGGPGGPGSFSSFSNFQGNSPNSVRLSPEDMQKLREAREAEEKEKAIAKEKEAKAKAEEESSFMTEIKIFLESSNRGTARSGQRNTAKQGSEFEESKENEFGESAKAVSTSIRRSEKKTNKARDEEMRKARNIKSFATGKTNVLKVTNLENLMEAAPTNTNFVTTTQTISSGPAISEEDYNFNQFRKLLSILNEEKQELSKQILILIQKYGMLVNQTGYSEQSAKILTELQILLGQGANSKSSRKFLRSLTEQILGGMILRLFELTRMGKRAAEEAKAKLVQSFVSSNTPAINSKAPKAPKAPNIQERPAEYGKAAERRTVNGRTEESGIQAYTTLTEGGPAQAPKNFKFSEGKVNQQKQINKKLLEFNSAKFSKSVEQKPNNASNEINKDLLMAQKIKFLINSNKSSGLKQEFEKFGKTYKGKKIDIYKEFAKLHQNLLESPPNSTTESEEQPSLTTEPEQEHNITNNRLQENKMQIQLKQLSRVPVPLLEVDFSSNSEKENKKKEILRIIRKHSLLHLFNQLLSTEVTISSVDNILDELYDDLTKFDKLASKKRELSTHEEGELSLLSSRYEPKFEQINRSETNALIEKLSIINGSAKIDRLKKKEKEAKEAEEKSRRAELNRLSQKKLGNLMEKKRTEDIDIIRKKKEIQRLQEKYKLTLKPEFLNLNVSEIYKDLREYDELKTAHPLYSVENSRNINAFLQKKYPEEHTIGWRAKRMTKNDLVNFFKTGRMEKGRMEKMFKKMGKEEERRRKENQEKLNQKELNRERLTTFAEAPELTKSFANVVSVSKNLPAVNSNKVSPITAPKPTYKNVLMRPIYKNILKKNKPSNATSNNKQQELKKNEMIIEEILKIEKMRGSKNPSRLSLIEKIKKSRLTENELLELYIIFAENSLNLLPDVNTRYKFEIKKLLKKINNKKYTKIIKDIEKSIKNQLNRSTMPNVSSPTESLEESSEESLVESSIEKQAELPNNSSVNKLLDISEKKFKILKTIIQDKEKEISEKQIEKRKLEKELIEVKKQKRTSKNPRTIQTEITKLDRNIKLLEGELRKKLKKIYEQFLNNLEGAKKALASIRTNLTNNKNELNEFKKINRFEEIMKELYELVEYLVKKYNFDGEEIQQKIIDDMEEYKELIYLRNNSNPKIFKEKFKNLYAYFKYLIERKKVSLSKEIPKQLIANMKKIKDPSNLDDFSKHLKALLTKYELSLPPHIITKLLDYKNKSMYYAPNILDVGLLNNRPPKFPEEARSMYN